VGGFDRVWTALGGSLLGPELRGNYRAARELAIAQRRSDDTRSDASAAALGLVLTVSGWPARGRRLLSTVIERRRAGEPVDDDSFVRALVARSVGVLTSCWLLPGGGANPEMTELRPRFDLTQWLSTQSAERDEIEAAAVEPALRLAAEFVYDIMWVLHLAEGTEAATGALVNPNAATTLTTELRNRIQSFDARATSSGFAAMGAFARLYSAQLLHRIKDPQRDLIVRSVYQQAVALGDHNLAGLAVLRATSWVIAPFGGPQVFDLALQESGGSGPDLAPMFEAMEGTTTLGGPWPVAEQLALADSYFEAASSPRGRGMVAIYKSHLAFAADDPEAQHGHADAAAQWFSDAGDASMSALAQVHRLVADVSRGALRPDVTSLAHVGRWGSRGGNGSFAVGLALLLNRVGRFVLHRRDDPTRAARLFLLGEQLARNLGASTTECQANAGRASCLRRLGLRSEALSLSREVVAKYLEDEAPSSTAEDSLHRAAEESETMLVLAVGMQDDEPLGDAIQAGTAVLGRLGPGNGTPTGAELVSLQQTDFVEFRRTMHRTFLLDQLGHADVAVHRCRMRRARVEATAATVDAELELVLAAAAQLSEPVCHFEQAIAFGDVRRVDEAVQSFERYLAAGGAGGGIGGILAAPMASFATAGSATLDANAHNNDAQAARFFANLRRFDKARVHLDIVAAIAGSDWWERESERAEALALIADVVAGEGDWETSLGYYDAAIAELERRWLAAMTDAERVALGNDRSAAFVFRGAASAASRGVEAGRDEYAARVIAYMDGYRARALFELVREDTASGPGGAEPTVRRRWRELTTRSADLQTARMTAVRSPGLRLPIDDEAALAETTLAAFEQQLRVEELSVAPREDDSSDLTLDLLRGALDDGSLLIAWDLVDDECILVGVSADLPKPVIVRVPCQRGELERHLFALTMNCRSGGSWSESADRLGQLLLDPLAEPLGRATRVVFVPSPEGQQTPLHLLTVAGAPLCASHGVAYVPSARIATTRRAMPTTPAGPGLAVGDPTDMRLTSLTDGATRNLRALPCTATEAAMVCAHTPDADLRVGPEATESELRRLLPSARTVHLATHGTLVADAPGLSSVALANGDQLSVSEILGLGMGPDLFVLSACDSGRGVATSGNEVIGLARALLVSGANAAVVSLWPTNDLAGCLIMKRFYDARHAGVPGPDALARAQHELSSSTLPQLVAEYRSLEKEIATSHVANPGAVARGAGVSSGMPDPSHPNFWAPFVYLGTR
jgi:CHAT domain-containing protein/tetratricopeptide (TPR) repeat protein